MIPIDRQVQQTMGAFRGQPDKLMQRYKQGNDLIDLLALQQMKSDMDAVKQQMVLSQQQMPGTIKDQREQEVLAGYKEKAGRQVGDVAKNTAGLLNQRQASVNANMQRQGITQQPAKTASNGGLMQMAGGGIVGFSKGGITQEEIDEYRKNLPLRTRNRISDAEIARRIKEPGFFAPEGGFSKARKGFQAEERARIEGGEVSSPKIKEPTLDFSPSPSVTPNLSVAKVEEEAPTTIVPPVKDRSNTGNENKAAAGLDSLNVAAPVLPNFDAEKVKTMVDPILTKYGLDDLKPTDEVRTKRIGEIDTALNREGRLAQKRSQLVRQEQLNKERLDPKELKRDSLLKGLIAASGGGNFAAVGAGIFNEEQAQDLLKQEALNKSLGIENDLMSLDLEIGKFGLQEAEKAESAQQKKEEAAATIVSTFTKEQLANTLQQARMELDANLGNARTGIEQVKLKYLDEYRKAQNDTEKRKVYNEMKMEILTLKEEARIADTKYQELKSAAEDEGFFGPDEDAIKEFEEYAKEFEVKWMEKENQLGISSLEKELLLGGSSDSFSTAERQP